MDKGEWVHKRKKRYMAQVLEAFERDLEPALKEAGLQDECEDFKGLFRRRINALAVDAVEVLELGDTAQNGAAQDLRDQLSPTGRP